MRKLLLAAGLLAVLAGAGLLLLPRLVDWNSLKPEIVATAKHLTGRDLAIDGRVRVTLLPRPRLTVTELRVQPARPELPPPFSLDVLELQLAPLPLLFGRFDVERLRLVAPTLTLTRDAGGRLNWDWPTSGDGVGWDGLALKDVVVADGRVVWSDAGRQPLTFDRVNLVAAGSLSGEISSAGRFVLDGERLGFALSLDRRASNGHTRIPLARIGREADGTEAVFNGRLTAEGDLDGKLRFRFDNAGEAMRALGWPEALAPFPSLPLTAEARIRSDGSWLHLEALTLLLGQERLSGELRVGTGEPARVEGELTATRFDLDALRRPARPPASGGDGLGRYLPATLSGRLGLRADGVTWNGGVMRQVEIGLGLEHGRAALLSARALLPGGGELTLASGGATDQDALFDGQVEARADDLRRLITWLGFDLRRVPPGRPGRLSFSAELLLTPEWLRLADASLSLDDTVAQGGMVYRLSDRPAFGLDIALDQIDLARYLPPGTTLHDLPLAALQGFDGNLTLKAGRVGYAGEELENLALDLGLVGGQLTVREASTRLGGGSVVLHASAGGFAGTPSYIGDLQVMSPRPAALLSRLAGLPPPRAGGFGALALEAQFEGKGPDLAFQATGDFGATAFETSGELRDLPVAPRLEASADWRRAGLGSVLTALGLTSPSPLDASLPLDMKLRLSGTAADLELRAEAELAGARLAAAGRITGAPAPALNLDLRLRHADAREFAAGLGIADLAGGFEGPVDAATRLAWDAESLRLQALAIAIGDQRLGGDASLAWPGVRRRIDARLAAGALDLGRWLPALSTLVPEQLRRLEGSLSLDAEALTLKGQRLESASLKIGFSPGVADIEALSGRLYGGRLSANGRLVAADTAALALSARLQDAELAPAATGLLGLDGVEGTLSLSLQLQDFADRPADLGRHIGGSLEIETASGRIDGLSLAATQEPLAGSGDAKAVAARLFAGGGTDFRAATGRWRLRDGVLRTDDTTASLDGGEARLTGEIDLNSRRLDLRAELLPALEPEPPALVVRLRGDAAAPVLSLDAGAFTAYLDRTRDAVRTPGPTRGDRPAP